MKSSLLKTSWSAAALIVVAASGILGSAQDRPAFAKRAPWTTSKITGAPEPPRPYVIERVFPSLAFDQPVELVVVPGTNRLVVLEVTGKIFSFADQPLAEK